MAPACLEWMKKKFVNWLTARRVLFVAVLLLQIGILSLAYLGTYSTAKGIRWMGVLVIPVLVPWGIIMFRKKQLSELCIVWSAYVVVLIVFVAYIFGWLRDKLDKTIFWGPNNLKITICLTPVIALLLLSTACDSREYADLVHKLYGEIVLELFDTIEVLAIVISAEESKLPQEMVITIIVLAAISLALSPLELAEKKLVGDGDYKKHKRLYLARLVAKKFLVNLALMIVRLVAWLEYEQEASIFIIKNATIIVISFISIMRLKKWCGLSDDN